MTTAIIVQARLGSTRLPGKVMMDLAGRTVLWHVLSRCRAIPGADVVVCATTTAAPDDAVAAEAERCGAVVFRGSESDVLARYHGAAVAVGADVVMRVTSDCPLIDPEVCSAVLRLRAEHGADYACNNMPPSWPHGLDCEAFTMAALSRAAAAATQPYEREHVTPWLRTAADIVRANLTGPGGNLAALRWTLDYAEDLEFFRAAMAHVPALPTLPDWRAIVAMLSHHPEISRINSARGERSSKL